jgi:hypothetical protein
VHDCSFAFVVGDMLDEHCDIKKKQQVISMTSK